MQTHKEWVEPFDPAKGNYVSESVSVSESVMTTTDGWQKERPSLYPPKPNANVQPESDAARLRTEAVIVLYRLMLFLYCFCTVLCCFCTVFALFLYRFMLFLC